MLPATARLPEVTRLVARNQYFAIHAARQSGKTTLLQGLVDDINASGERVALYFTVESVQAYPDPHDGIAKIMEWSGGQPWLVNALASECVEEIHGFRYSEPITPADIETAKETIIRKNPIHLDYLFDMVNTPSVRPYFDACIQGTITEEQRSEVPFKFLRYLGFLHEADGRFEFANSLYRDHWRKRTVRI